MLLYLEAIELFLVPLFELRNMVLLFLVKFFNVLKDLRPLLRQGDIILFDPCREGGEAWNLAFQFFDLLASNRQFTFHPVQAGSQVL